ncbi:MAG: hypothetical protein BYD32DRAFT_430918 [Podila humilis]|nr:MAG: hypothetical protein BYD32DRAFT_430918 [Podila humilis]
MTKSDLSHLAIDIILCLLSLLCCERIYFFLPFDSSMGAENKRSVNLSASVHSGYIAISQIASQQHSYLSIESHRRVMESI